MQEKWLISLLGLSILFSLASQATSSTSQNEFFTSSFLVRFKRSVDSSEANEIARRNAFHSLGPVSISTYFSCHMENVYLFSHVKHFYHFINPEQAKENVIKNVFHILSVHRHINRSRSLFKINFTIFVIKLNC